MATDAGESSEQQRDESPIERWDRNTIELLNELRVAGTGIQIMFAFLLVAPFNTGFKHLSQFGRVDYFVTLVCVAAAAILLLAPTIQHRILFRRGEKRYLVLMANRLAIMAMIFLAFGFTGILVLLADVVLGGPAPVVIGLVAGAAISGLWFALPLLRREDG
ncbi:MAG: DUF6328 family protein [Actinomycetota bacterium]|nr:DUF6328 family protein [Actinomycetota bacterium]